MVDCIAVYGGPTDEMIVGTITGPSDTVISGTSAVAQYGGSLSSSSSSSLSLSFLGGAIAAGMNR
jgi:hypothetical protein